MNRALPLLLFLLLALGSCGQQAPAGLDDCTSTSSKPDQRIAACTRLIDSGQLSSQHFTTAFHQRGLARADKRDYGGAISDYNEALRINPFYAVVYYHRFMAERDKRGSPSPESGRKAAPSTDPGGKQAPSPAADPKDAAGYNKRGIAWSEKRDYDRAIADYTEALRLNPQYHFAYYNRGIAWRNKGDADRAIADYSEALRLNPKYADAYNNRGIAWASKRDYERAIADYGEALRLNPKDAKALNNRGYAWASKGDYERAMTDYNEALRLDPQYALAYYNRGNAWRSKRDYERAIADYSEALRINPQYALAYANRGHSWVDKGDYNRAIADYNEALRLNPQNAGIHNSAAWLLATAPVAAVRNGARAVELARKAADLSKSKDADILDTLAAAYAEAANFSEAVRWQEKALEFPEFAKDQGDAARKRLERYRKGQPYHQPSRQ